MEGRQSRGGHRVSGPEVRGYSEKGKRESTPRETATVAIVVGSVALVGRGRWSAFYLKIFFWTGTLEFEGVFGINIDFRYAACARSSY